MQRTLIGGFISYDDCTKWFGRKLTLGSSNRTEDSLRGYAGADHYCRRSLPSITYPMMPSFFSVALSSATFSGSMPVIGRRSSSVQ